MVKRGMSLPCIPALQQISQCLLPLGWWRRDSVPQRFVKTGSVRHWRRVPKRKPEVPQVVDCHSRNDDLDVLLAEFGDGLAQAVVLDGIFGFEEGDLDDGHVQGVVVRVEC